MDGPSGGRASPDRAACCPRALRAGRVGEDQLLRSEEVER